MYPRHAERTIRTSLEDTRVVAIIGPRQSGKTTLARQIAGNAYEYLSLDDATVLAAAIADPTRFVSRLDRAVIDEVQSAPALTLTIKLAVDTDQRPGRFLLTGSSDFLATPTSTDSLAGRVETVELLPLARGEILRRPPARFIDRAFAGDPPSGDADDILQAALTGGYPEALIRQTERRRHSWHRAYRTALLERDVADVATIEHWDKMPVLFELLARASGQLVNWAGFGGQLGLNGRTVEKYVGILEQLFLVRRIQAWSGNEVQRLVSSAKLHFLDSGLLASTLNLTAASLAMDRTALGPVLESFVCSELIKAMPYSQIQPRLYHYRDRDQVEVDFVLEDGKRRLVGIEIKAASTVTAQDFKGLKRLQTHVGKPRTLRWHARLALWPGPHGGSAVSAVVGLTRRP
jgi:uncharacterized protein